MTMLYTRETTGDADAVGKRLEEAVKARKFGVLGVIDLQAKMKEKGIDFKNACRIYEVCNPQQAQKVLEKDMSISTALPCRISVYREEGKIKISSLLPTQTLGLFGLPDLAPVAREVEQAIVGIIDAAVEP